MVAYSFKQMFVPAIRIGLGLDVEDPLPGARRPKRQTIRRVGLRRHAMPGQQLQLYSGMRTKHCTLIGKAVCVQTKAVVIGVGDTELAVSVDGRPVIGSELDAFAEADGFATVEDMHAFWRQEHPGVSHFEGVGIFWRPVPRAEITIEKIVT